jgi:prepilin-type N-terminal cleavage/methylation domain-containing protein
MRSGHTLIEVITVLAILGLGAAAAAPAYRAFAHTDETAAVAGSVADALRTAARMARERASIVTVIMDSTSLQYWVVVPGDTVTTGSLGGSAVRIAMSAARTMVSFEADGRASHASLSVHGPAGARYIEIDAWTGDIQVRR